MRGVGNTLCTRAKNTRPTVTMTQNVVRASEAVVAEAPRCDISVSDQFPFIVSQMP